MTDTKPLNVDEAAQFTGYTKKYIYYLVETKKIPFHKPNNGRIFFSRKELETYLYGDGNGTSEDMSKKADKLLIKNARKRKA
jgi:excisionase family DNA binding protein